MNNMKTIALILIFMAVSNLSMAQSNTGSDMNSQIDDFAQFPGGAELFFQYIRDNLKYPSDAQRDSVSGVVYVEFTVSEAGSILPASIEVKKSLNSTCDAEALRIIRTAPSWLPAKSNGVGVAQSVTFPVSFEWKAN